MHKSEDEISKELENARQKVKIGGSYAHYKNPKNTYEVLNLGITEANDEVCVIYQARYGNNLIFVRPLANWLDKVEVDGEIVDRFFETKV